jgi:hypothetical protein
LNHLMLAALPQALMKRCRVRTSHGLQKTFSRHRDSHATYNDPKEAPMTLSPLLRSPRLVELGIRIDTAPAWWWLAGQFAAVGSVWLLAAHSLPGAAALAIAACVLWPVRHQLRAAPRLEWLTLALAATLACAWLDAVPAGLLALAAALLAYMPGALPAAVASPLWHWLFGNTFVNRVAHKTLFAGAMLLCMAWALVQGIAGTLAR